MDSTETQTGGNGETKAPRFTMADVFAMGAPRSEPFTFDYKGKSIEVVFQLLADADKDRCLLDAAQFISDEKWRRITRRQVDGVETTEAWAASTDEALATVQQAHADRLIIAAAVINPETGIPVATVAAWRQVPDRLLSFLKDKYVAFEQSLDPSKLSEAEIQMCFEMSKKKDLGLLLTVFDSRTLGSCLIYLVSLWEASIDGEFDGLSSGENESSPNPDSPTTP